MNQVRLFYCWEVRNFPRALAIKEDLGERG